MAKKWSPSKEHKGPQHLIPSYISGVMGGNPGEDGLEGDIDNKGGSQHGNPTHPPLNKKPHIANNGKGDWETKS
jgi:hypothetical protein